MATCREGLARSYIPDTCHQLFPLFLRIVPVHRQIAQQTFFCGRRLPCTRHRRRWEKDIFVPWPNTALEKNMSEPGGTFTQQATLFCSWWATRTQRAYARLTCIDCLPFEPPTFRLRAGRSNCPGYLRLAKHRARLSYGPTRQSKKAWFL